MLWRARQLLGPADFRIVEEPLVDSAIDLRFGDFEKTVEYVIVRAAPADADERARRDLEDRYASSSPVGSNGKVDAQMDAIGFGPWQAELERLMDHLLEEDRTEARDRLGRAPLPSELRRTTRQRRVDAMVLMARRSAAFGDDDLGPMPFTTTVHVTPEFLAALIAVLTKALNPENDPGFDLDDTLDRSNSPRTPCTNSTTAPSSPSTPSCWPCSPAPSAGSSMTPPARSSATDEPAASSPPPKPPPSEPRADAAPIPGAATDQGPSTQTDHTVEHQHGGPTDIDNADRYCGPHNIWKTNHLGQPPPPGAGPPDTDHRRTPPQPGRPNTTEPPDQAAA